MKQAIKLGLILSLYAAASCTILALVNNVTAPVIAQNQITKANNAMKSVFPSADSFETVQNSYTPTSSSISIDKLYAAKKNGSVIGAVVQVTGPTYDHGTIVVGVDKDGIVTGMEFLELNDTPGFGLKASDSTFRLESGKTFYGQFEGKKVSAGFEAGETFDAISGATITSKGVAALMAQGCAAAMEYLGGAL